MSVIYHNCLKRMDVFGINIPDKTLTNFDLIHYAEKLDIPKFRGVFMRDSLPAKPKREESAIVNLNRSDQRGSHWVCYYKRGLNRIYFDSFGQITPIEIQNYLKRRKEQGIGVIHRNTDIVQPINTNICGHLCLFVIKALSSGWSFQQILNRLNGYT